MIPRKIGAPPDQRGFNIDRGIYIMPVNKIAGVKKVKLGLSAKKAAIFKKATPKQAIALKKATPKQTVILKKAAPKSVAALKNAKPAPAPKTAATKKATGPKLTAPQHELLKRVVANKNAKGYHTAKKPEHRVLETLLRHKVVQKGSKHPETKLFHYQVSTIGKKYLESSAVPKS
jgi:hypothetical protein